MYELQNVPILPINKIIIENNGLKIIKENFSEIIINNSFESLHLDDFLFSYYHKREGEIDGIYIADEDFNFYSKNEELSQNTQLIFMETPRKKNFDYEIAKGNYIILSVKNNFDVLSAFDQLTRHMRQFNRLIPSVKKHFVLLLCQDTNNKIDFSKYVIKMEKTAIEFNSN